MQKVTRMDTSSIDTSTKFSRMVDEDIQRCSAYLAGSREEAEGNELHLELITKYPAYISRFGTSLYNYNDNTGFTLVEYFDGESMIHNLMVIKSKLVAFQSYGYKNSKTSTDVKAVYVENHLTATQSQTISISFEDVKRQIEDMSGLSAADTNEAVEQIDAIKVIVESDDSKKSKWQKLKPILLWLADKSVDVGTALLPLILKIGG